MRQLLIKYLIIAIITFVAVKLITTIIITIWPDLLIMQQDNGEVVTLGTEYLSRVIDYIFNIIIIFFLFKDMKREKVINIPILILTFFFNVLGIVFFLLTISYNKLIIQNPKYEQIN